MYKITINKIENSAIPNNGSFLQTPFWCNFKARHGWSYNRFLITYILPFNDVNECKKENHQNFSQKEISCTFELAVLNRSFAKGMCSIAYIPLMPNLPFECTPETQINQVLSLEKTETTLDNFITPETQSFEFAYLLKELSMTLKPFLPKNTIAIRFDPNVSFNTPEERDLFNFGLKTISKTEKLKLRKNKVDIQPPDSTLIDLTATEEEILSRMHQKWRYNIRLSAKKGVTITKYSGNDANLSEKIDKFYELTKETNARDGNSSHTKSYYLDLIKSSAQQIQAGNDVPQINLYIAEHNGDEIAAIMTLFSHDESIYLYGASSNQKRNLMPNHLLQWTAIKDAKAYGSKYYDMYGMPPEGKNENHPMHGLYMFKANFGGKNIHRIGSWDITLKRIYVFYNIAESFRAFWHKVVMKKVRGR